MDKWAEYRFLNKRKLESYVDMAGMTVYRDEDNRITGIRYKDYSFGDPEEEWRARCDELGFPDPDEIRLPLLTKNRYCLDYWRTMGGPYRHEPLRLQAEAEKIKSPTKAEKTLVRDARRYKAGLAKRAKQDAAEEKRVQHEKNQVATIRRAQDNKKTEEISSERARILARNFILQSQGRAPQPPITSLTEKEISELQGKLPRNINATMDMQHQEMVARRMRQGFAMDSGAAFSTPQKPCSSSVITWSDPHITNMRLARLVLGPDRGSREMTAEEESDYWYHLARAAMKS
jgi:hypothetical protein